MQSDNDFAVLGISIDLLEDGLSHPETSLARGRVDTRGFAHLWCGRRRALALSRVFALLHLIIKTSFILTMLHLAYTHLAFSSLLPSIHPFLPPSLTPSFMPLPLSSDLDNTSTYNHPDHDHHNNRSENPWHCEMSGRRRMKLP